MNPFGLVNPIDSWLFNTDTRDFFKIWKWFAFPYGLFEIWHWDYSVYKDLSPFLFKPVGFFENVSLNFPDLKILFIIQVVATGFALVGLLTRYRGIATFLFFLCFFFLDFIQNSFGFIHVEIHLAWFFLLYSLVSYRGNRRHLDSFLFRMMELVVVLAYAQSGISKLVQSGPSWALDGTTLQIAGLRQGTVLGHWLSQYHFLCQGLSVAALIMELGFCSYYLFPGLRKYLLAMAFFFHLGTWALLNIQFGHLWIFYAPVLIWFPTLLSPSDFKKDFKKLVEKSWGVMMALKM